jgi:hypothetical protein
MSKRTRLYQSTGSPLIQGRTGARRSRIWPWLLLGAVTVAAALWVYLTYLR